jgi:hypothetical protein
MNIKKTLWLLPFLLVPLGLAMADWVAKDPSNNNVVFSSFSTQGNKVLPKRVLTDSSGLNIASVSSAGALKGDPGTAAQPVTQSGSWNVNMTGPLPTGSNIIGAVSQGGSAWGANLAQVLGSPPSATNNLPTQLTNADGNLVATGNPLAINCVSGCANTGAEVNLPTYSLGYFFLEPAVLGDKTCVFGSATKVVRIKKITFNAFNATAAVNNYGLYRRGSANTGGVISGATSVAKNDSNDPAPTATAVAYTTVPTSGTDLGRFLAFSIYTSGSMVTTVFTFGAVDRGSKSIVLRGINEGVCIRSATAIANNIYFSWEWTEE